MASSTNMRGITGVYWLAEYGDIFWPSIAYPDDMVPDHLIRSRPPGDVVPVLLMGKLEFIWAQTATLLPYSHDNLSVLEKQPGNEELCEAYRAVVRSRWADLDYWDDHLRDHLLAKSLRDSEATDNQYGKGNNGRGVKRLYSSSEGEHDVSRATLKKRNISERAFGKMSRKKAHQLGLLSSSSDDKGDDDEEGERASADHTQNEEGSTSESFEMDSEAEEGNVQVNDDINNLEIVLPYTTINGEGSKAPHSPDPSIVTIYVGNPAKGFQTPKDVVMEHRHLADCIMWSRNIGLRLIRRRDSKIDPADFFPVAEFFTFGDFEPKLMSRSTTSAYVDGINTDSAKTDAMRICATTFCVARRMLLPYLIELIAEKFEALRPWSAVDIVMVAEIILKKDCADLEDEEDFRSVLIQYLASTLWDFDRSSQHRLRGLMDTDPYFAKALLGRMFTLSMTAYRDKILRERADSGIGIESEKE